MGTIAFAWLAWRCTQGHRGNSACCDGAAQARAFWVAHLPQPLNGFGDSVA